jgi:hypothetical protein
MEHIYVGFSSPKKRMIGAKLICDWLGKPYSHVYIKFISSNSNLPNVVYHAAKGMVHFVSEENFNEVNETHLLYCLNIDSSQKLSIVRHCINIASVEYGYIELLKIFISNVYYKITKKNIDFKNHKGYICSELVGEILKKTIKINFKKPLFLLTPKDIEYYLDLHISTRGEGKVTKIL